MKEYTAKELEILKSFQTRIADGSWLLMDKEQIETLQKIFSIADSPTINPPTVPKNTNQ